MRIVALAFALVLILAAGCTAQSSKNAKKTARIIGGRKTTIGKAKYLVSLRRSGEFSCGASIVAPRFVVTAAHCVYGYSRSAITIHAGSTNLNSSGTQRSVVRVFLPKNYNSNTMHLDVAVLKLNTALEGSNIATIGLCTRNIKAGMSMRIYGWGVASLSSNTASNQLKTAQVKVRSRKTCTRSYRSVSPITETMICAAGNRRDSCAGDSGGPLVHKGQLCGIVSWGVGCANRAYPGVYTNINKVKRFIRSSLTK